MNLLENEQVHIYDILLRRGHPLDAQQNKWAGHMVRLNKETVNNRDYEHIKRDTVKDCLHAVLMV